MSRCWALSLHRKGGANREWRYDFTDTMGIALKSKIFNLVSEIDKNWIYIKIEVNKSYENILGRSSWCSRHQKMVLTQSSRKITLLSSRRSAKFQIFKSHSILKLHFLPKPELNATNSYTSIDCRSWFLKYRSFTSHFVIPSRSPHSDPSPSIEWRYESEFW